MVLVQILEYFVAAKKINEVAVCLMGRELQEMLLVAELLM